MLSDQPILEMHNSSFKMRTTLRWIQESKLSFKHHSFFNVYVYARDRSNILLFNTVCTWYYETNFRGIRHLTMSRRIFKSVLLKKINRFTRKATWKGVRVLIYFWALSLVYNLLHDLRQLFCCSFPSWKVSWNVQMKSVLKRSIQVFSKLNIIINILTFVKSLPKPFHPPVQRFALFFLFAES